VGWRWVWCPFYRVGELRGGRSTEGVPMASECTFKSFSYRRGVNGLAALGEEGESMMVLFLSSSVGGQPVR
jgi:hypothetical protein